ncbi:MAG: sigma-70 family RNA polymerase sigma factor [Nitriliruptoraceae bacterium]
MTTGGWVFGEGFDRTLADARRGDETAWTKLYLDLAPVLTGYLIGRGARNPEDVTSETLLQVVRDLRSFDGDESSFRSWVFTLAHHRMVDDARRTAARPADATAGDVLERVAPAHSFEDVSVSHLGPAELSYLLAATTPDQRDVLLLRYVADLTLHEAAEVLDKDYNAVKALHRRGLDALRAHVASGSYPQGRARALSP